MNEKGKRGKAGDSKVRQSYVGMEAMLPRELVSMVKESKDLRRGEQRFTIVNGWVPCAQASVGHDVVALRKLGRSCCGLGSV